MIDTMERGEEVEGGSFHPQMPMDKDIPRIFGRMEDGTMVFA
jgi:hypothetical protein